MSASSDGEMSPPPANQHGPQTTERSGVSRVLPERRRQLTHS
ncbi:MULTISPECIES: hypothetical protein [unclassified Pseudonocardia]|nr:hypothetical protein [Pseudonocardia sp. Ae706_Ps2]